MKRKWVVAKRQHADVIQHLLLSRAPERSDQFLHPAYSDRHDPTLLPNLAAAVERLKYAIDRRQTIGLYGDYDCDGIPGTALLTRVLRLVGVEPKVYIPRRESGYGLSRSGLDQLKDQNVDLVITIDNGTAAVDEIKYGRDLGLDFIVTDHHEPHSKLPDCLVINPKLPGSLYPFRELCGTAVVFKLIEGLSQHFPDQLSERVLKWHLDLVALATICDMVELIGENRTLTSFGLTVLCQTRNLGLRALLQVAGVDHLSLTSGNVGYILGPRINAAGRMDEDPMLGFHLLTTDDDTQALEIAQTLHHLNTERQDALNVAVRQAESQIQDEAPDAAIVLQNPAWSPGIVGLIAAKMLERYHKPTFIFDAKTGKGSARSVSDYALPSALDVLAKHFLSYGGHNLAGGMQLKPNVFPDFRRDLIEHAGIALGRSERAPHLHIDAEINLNEATSDIAQKINAFEPFGIGNPRPMFVVRGLSTRDAKVIGHDRKHLRGTLSQSNVNVPFVAFGLAERKNELLGGQFDVAGRLELNHWNGRTIAELHVVDVDNSK